MQQQIERGKRPSYVHVHSISDITLTFWWLCLERSDIANVVDRTSHGCRMKFCSAVGSRGVRLV
jgi:hypothetical protein